MKASFILQPKLCEFTLTRDKGRKFKIRNPFCTDLENSDKRKIEKFEEAWQIIVNRRYQGKFQSVLIRSPSCTDPSKRCQQQR